jgi:hypothetical protein
MLSGKPITLFGDFMTRESQHQSHDLLKSIKIGMYSSKMYQQHPRIKQGG